MICNFLIFLIYLPYGSFDIDIFILPWNESYDILLDDQAQNFINHFCHFFVSVFDIFYFDSFGVRRFVFSEKINRYSVPFTLNSDMYLSASSSSIFFCIIVSIIANIFNSSCVVLLLFSVIALTWQQIFEKSCKFVSNYCSRYFDVSDSVSQI